MKGTPKARRKYGLQTVNGFGSRGSCPVEYPRNEGPARRPAMRVLRADNCPSDLRRGVYDRVAIFGIGLVARMAASMKYQKVNGQNQESDNPNLYNKGFE